MSDTTPPRKVTWLLGTGIVFVPYIFSWFTLKQGYSKNAQIASFIWMSAVLLLIGSNREKNHQEVKPQQQEPAPRAELSSQKSVTPADLLRKWASDMPDDQLRKVCAAGSIGAIAFSNELKSGAFISDQKFADDVLSYPNEIAPEYLPAAELVLKTAHNTYLRKQDAYRQILETQGLAAFADGANHACRAALRKALGH